MARDDIAVAGMQNALVVTDSEFDRALDHKTQLLILMVVVGRLGVGLEVDERHRDAFPVNRPSGEPFSKQDRGQVAERPERFHYTTAWARMRARGRSPSCFAFSSDIKSTAAAPSEIWLELPAVIVCSGLNAGCNDAAAS